MKWFRFKSPAKVLSNKWGCFSSPKPPAQSTPPQPAPAPTISQAETSSSSLMASQEKRRQALRAGLASTIKTSARGITGAGPDVISPSLIGAKTKLGG